MHYPDSRWRPRCQGKSRDDVSGRMKCNIYTMFFLAFFMNNNNNNKI